MNKKLTRFSLGLQLFTKKLPLLLLGIVAGALLLFVLSWLGDIGKGRGYDIGNFLVYITIVLVFAVLLLIFLFFVAMSLAKKELPSLQILSEKGFCPEYADAYFNAHIKGKNKNDFRYLMMGSICLTIKRYNEAYEWYQRVDRAGLTEKFRALYFLDIVELNLRTNNVAAANKILSDNIGYLREKAAKHREVALMLNAKIAMERAMSGDYAKAAEVINTVQPTDSKEFNFVYVLMTRVFIYARSGNQEYRQMAKQQAVSYIDGLEAAGLLPYKWSKDYLLEQLAKAENGEIA